MFVVLFVEEGYAEVVEVETDNGWDASEPLAMLMQVVEQEHGMFSQMLQNLVCGLFQEAHTHLSHLPATLYSGALATALQIAFLPPSVLGKQDGGGLQMVGQTEHEMQAFALAEAFREGQSLVEFLIGIEGVTLVDDIRDEAEGEGTVHAVTFAMTETCEPNEWICHFLHNWSTKISIFS